MLGVFYLKLNAVYVCNGTTDLKRNDVINVSDDEKRKAVFCLESITTPVYMVKK